MNLVQRTSWKEEKRKARDPTSKGSRRSLCPDHIWTELVAGITYDWTPELYDARLFIACGSKIPKDSCPSSSWFWWGRNQIKDLCSFRREAELDSILSQTNLLKKKRRSQLVHLQLTPSMWSEWICGPEKKIFPNTVQVKYYSLMHRSNISSLWIAPDAESYIPPPSLGEVRQEWGSVIVDSGSSTINMACFLHTIIVSY